MDERKATILRAVVEEYIQTAQPVGSGHIARAPGVGVSSATVRSEMVALEQDGYLYQPHTSAGRVPTEKGYRFFVDTLGEPDRLAGADAKQVRAFFARAHGEIEGMLEATSRLLSDLTSYTAVVVGPAHEAAAVRSVQVVGLAPQLALVVLVLSNGVVEKHNLDLDEDVDEITLTEASARLSSRLVGRPRVIRPEDASDGPAGPADRCDTVVRRVLSVLGAGADDDQDVFIGGTSNMAAAFDAVGTVREVLRVLEEHYVVVSLLRDVVDRGLHVAIGTETGMEPLADAAVVVAPYEVDGEQAGSIGVLGPTRMHYPQAMAAVAVVSRRLGRRLSEG